MAGSLVSFCITIMGCLMVFDAIRGQRRRRRLQRVGILAEATVIRLKWDTQSECHYSVFRFRTPQHGWIVAREPQNSGSLNHRVGQSVPIYYHPDDPRQLIPGRSKLPFGTVLLALTGLILIVYGFVASYS